MAESAVSNNDVVIASNEPAPGAAVDNSLGDIIFKTSGVERARIKYDGSSFGLGTLQGALEPVDFGLTAWTYPPTSAGGVALTSQTIYGCAVKLRAGQVVTNIWAGVTVAAAGTPPTTIKLGLVDQTGARLAVTANVTADSKWTSTGYKSFAVATPYTVVTTGVYLIVALEDGVFGTTPLQLSRLSAGAVGAINSVYGDCLGGTGQTDIGSSLVLAASTATQQFWFGIS